jgi:hypothetical protein
MPTQWFGANPIAEVWATKPFQLPGFSYERMMRGTGFLRVIGRMKPGITVEQVRAALPSLEQDYRAHYANKIDSTANTSVKTLPQDVTENIRAGFATLFAAVCFVLLIACSNVANLLLVRFSSRRREIALRMAVGASRSSVVRLFVWESLLVSLFAGALGAFVAWRLVPLVPKMASNFLPLEGNTASSLSLPVLGFTIALSMLTGLLMGIYPALQGSHADLVGGLKEGGRGTSGSIRQQRFRKILVGAQVALSVTLFAGAALLITSFIRLTQQNLGFQPHNLWVGAIAVPVSQYPDGPSRQRFATYQASKARLSAAIFPSLVEIARFTRARIAMCRQWKSERIRQVTTLCRAISTPGESRSSPDVISMNTISRKAGASVSLARRAQKRFFRTKIPSARRCWSPATVRRWKLSASSAMCGHSGSLNCPTWNFIGRGPRKTFHS